MDVEKTNLYHALFLNLLVKIDHYVGWTALRQLHISILMIVLK
jgi:hypothetical protein